MFLFLLPLLARPFCAAAESSPQLIVATMAAHLHARQEENSEIITSLDKGEELLLLGQALGTSSWYMVKTAMGAIGWVQSADVRGVSSLEDPMPMGSDLNIFRSRRVPTVVHDQSTDTPQPGYQDPSGHPGQLNPEEQKADGKNMDVQRREGRSNGPYQIIIDQNVKNLTECVALADAADRSHWNKMCAIQGEPRGCALLGPVAVDLAHAHGTAIDQCYKRFPEH